jgi:hypothetical protein
MPNFHKAQSPNLVLEIKNTMLKIKKPPMLGIKNPMLGVLKLWALDGKRNK